MATAFTRNKSGPDDVKHGIWLRLILAAMFALGLSTCHFFGGDPRPMSEQHTITLPFKIHSTPALWRAKDGQWRVAVVRGRENPDEDRMSAVDAYTLTGKQVSGFPVLSASVPALKVPPTSQLGVMDGGDGEELRVMDLEGRLWAYHTSGQPLQAAPAAKPAHAVLTWPPRVIPWQEGRNALVLLSFDAHPMGRSLNQLELVDGQGRSLPGFPVRLGTRPTPHPPVWDAGTGLFVLFGGLKSVEGFDRHSGKPLPGFPVELPAGIKAKYELGTGFSYDLMVYHAVWKALVLSNGEAALVVVDTATGKVRREEIPGAQRLTAVASDGIFLYLLDETRRRLLVVDARKQVTREVDLTLPEYTRVESLQAVPLPGTSQTAVVLISAPETDHDAWVVAMFEKHGTAQELKEIQALADKDAMRAYQTLNLNPAQRKEIDQDIIDMKDAYLEKIFTQAELSKLYSSDAHTRIQILFNGPQGTTLAVDEKVPHFNMDAANEFSPRIYPDVRVEEKTRTLIVAVPLNDTGTKAGLPKQERSVLKIYPLIYPKGVL